MRSNFIIDSFNSLDLRPSQELLFEIRNPVHLQELGGVDTMSQYAYFLNHSLVTMTRGYSQPVSLITMRRAPCPAGSLAARLRQ